MRVVLQRTTQASVTINKETYSFIEKGLVVFVGIQSNDDISDVQWLSSKIINLRIFNDDNGVMNLSLKDIKGDMLIVSQFTLHALTKKGNRPSYIKAAHPDISKPLYEAFIAEIRRQFPENKIATGVFGADMQIQLINDGPVTILIDSKNKE